MAFVSDFGKLRIGVLDSHRSSGSSRRTLIPLFGWSALGDGAHSRRQAGGSQPMLASSGVGHAARRAAACATRPASKSEIAAKDHEKLVFDDLALLEERYAVQVWSGR